MNDEKYEVKYTHTDEGFCQVHYVLKTESGKKAYYCAQDEGGRFGGVKFYRCTDSTWLEPSHEVQLKRAPPLCPGVSDLEKKVNEWIKNKWPNDETGKNPC